MTSKDCVAAFGRPFRTIFDIGAVAGLTDGELLDRFASRQGESAELAFAAILERHGAMVYRVCRKVLGDDHDALDAFQATFLVLVRRARSVRKADSIASWLHGVAFRVASCDRAAGTRRRKHEQLAFEGSRRSESPGDPDDLGSILHRELDRLPDRYRAPLVLCHLEGMTHEQAAERLGLPVGTVKSRMARGRERLKARLSRRGLELSRYWGFAGTSKSTPPPMVMDATARAATKLAAGQPIAGMVPASAVALMQGVLKTMTLKKIKLTAVGLLAAGIAAAAAGVLAQQPEPIPTTAPATGKVVERTISYDLRFIEMTGLAWRTELHRSLKPLARKGPYTVWTVDDDTLRQLADRGKNVQAPRVTAFEDAKAMLVHETKKSTGAIMVQMDHPKEMPAPFPFDGRLKLDPAMIQARAEANPPLPPMINEQDETKGVKLPDFDVQEIRDGVEVQLQGHRVDGGILIQAEIDSSEIVSYNVIPIPQQVRIGGELVERRLFVGVPEITQSHYHCERVVPTDAILVVGLGIHQFHNEGNPPEIRERLVAFRAREVALPSPLELKQAVPTPAPLDRP